VSDSEVWLMKLIDEFGLDVQSSNTSNSCHSLDNKMPWKLQYYIQKKVPMMIHDTVYISCQARDPRCG
jgi:hypothetical protein